MSVSSSEFISLACGTISKALLRSKAITDTAIVSVESKAEVILSCMWMKAVVVLDFGLKPNWLGPKLLRKVVLVFE